MADLVTELVADARQWNRRARSMARQGHARTASDYFTYRDACMEDARRAAELVRAEREATNG